MKEKRKDLALILFNGQDGQPETDVDLTLNSALFISCSLHPSSPLSHLPRLRRAALSLCPRAGGRGSLPL